MNGQLLITMPYDTFSVFQIVNLPQFRWYRMRKSGLKLWDENFSEGMSFPQGIERSFVDRKRVGEVFIVVFRTDQVNRKTAHHAIVIDVAGSSDEDFLQGLMVHLTANVLTRIVKFRVEDNPWKRDEFYEIVRIGQLLPTTPDPHYWAMELHSKVSEIKYFSGDHPVHCRLTRYSMISLNKWQTIDGHRPSIVKHSLGRSLSDSVFNGQMNWLTRVINALQLLLMWQLQWSLWKHTRKKNARKLFSRYRKNRKTNETALLPFPSLCSETNTLRRSDLIRYTFKYTNTVLIPFSSRSFLTNKKSYQCHWKRSVTCSVFSLR